MLVGYFSCFFINFAIDKTNKVLLNYFKTINIIWDFYQKS